LLEQIDLVDLHVRIAGLHSFEQRSADAQGIGEAVPGRSDNMEKFHDNFSFLDKYYLIYLVYHSWVHARQYV
jgi:hypothetical protein